MYLFIASGNLGNSKGLSAHIVKANSGNSSVRCLRQALFAGCARTIKPAESGNHKIAIILSYNSNRFGAVPPRSDSNNATLHEFAADSLQIAQPAQSIHAGVVRKNDASPSIALTDA
jgi:hypothetical protein